MSSIPRRVWVTRTPPQAEATAARVRALGLQAVVAPVLQARRLVGAAIDLAGVDAIAFTSGHALRAFTALSPMRDLPVFAVGETTAALARESGFTRVRSSAGGARALSDLIAATNPRPALVLHPTLAEPAADLGALLANADVGVRQVAVYETGDAGMAAIPDGVDSILIHSAKAAAMVARLATPERAARLDVFAISPAAAAPLGSLAFKSISTAPFPTEAALLLLLKS